MNTEYVVFGFVNVAFALVISPLFTGIIKKVKAAVQRRRGPPLLQSYYNLAKLMMKETVYSSNSSQIMRVTPYVNMAVMVTAALCIPLAFIPNPALDVGNVILFLYLLALARFFMALAGLDAGSTFGGMGSSREMSISSVIEPITVVVFAALFYTFKTLNFHEMFRQAAGSAFIPDPALVLIALPLFIVLIVETARIPVDNPETHLELTMVHEAMLLEYSGRDLALMELSAAIKQTLLMGLLINVLIPWGVATQMVLSAVVVGLVAFFVKAVFLAVVIGLFESSIAKMRLFNLPNMFMIAFFLSAITLLLEVFR
ncbi:MAG: respiratory chain complex I subunit 1 family protein [Candidatus Altiarchaeota archaeon]